MSDVTRPTHYGGDANPFEPIKIIEHYDLGFHLGNTIKYVLRSDKKGAELDDLRKAHWYLGRRIEQLQRAQDALGPPFDVTMDIVRADGATETRTIRGMRTRDESITVGSVPKGDRIGALQVTGRTTFADAAAAHSLREDYRFWGDSSGGAWSREPVVTNILDTATAERVDQLLERGEKLDALANRAREWAAEEMPRVTGWETYREARDAMYAEREARRLSAEDVVNELRVHGVIEPERYVRRAEEVVAAGGYDAERATRYGEAASRVSGPYNVDMGIEIVPKQSDGPEPDEPWSSPLINQEYRWNVGQTIAAATATPAFAKADGKPEPKVQLSRHPRTPYKPDPAPRHQYLHGIGEDARRRHHEARLGVFTQLNSDGSVTATHITSGTGMTIVDKKASIERRRARAIKELLAHLKDRTDIMSQPLDTGMEHAP